MIVTEAIQAKDEIGAAWMAYKNVKPVCLKFGDVCYTWQQKLGTVGLEAVWKELKIPAPEGYREMDGYLESQGVTRLRIEKRSNRDTPDEFEDIRKVALTMLNLGFKNLKQTDIKASLLDSAKKWALSRLNEKNRENIVAEQAA